MLSPCISRRMQKALQRTLKGKAKVQEGVPPKAKRLSGRQNCPVSQPAPPAGWTKVNTDGAYCHRTGKASVGVVASDNNDGVPLSASRTIHHCGSPEEAEADALLEGLRLASEWLRNLPVYAESDCSNLVRGCTRGWR
jgi:hypothetical protein